MEWVLVAMALAAPQEERHIQSFPNKKACEEARLVEIDKLRQQGRGASYLVRCERAEARTE